MTIIRLHALDEYGRRQAEAIFCPARRKNEATLRRENGYRLLLVDGKDRVDFGNQTFWLKLPIGTCAGVVQGAFPWQQIEY